MKSGAIAAVLIAIIAVFSIVTTSANPMYVVDLQLDPAWSEATAINDVGQIACAASSCPKPFVWQDGVLTAISEPLWTSSIAPFIIPGGGGGTTVIRSREFDISSQGQVVGSTLFGFCPHVIIMNSSIAAPGNAEGSVSLIYPESAFLWHDGVISVFEGLPSPSSATGINRHGQIVGKYRMQDDATSQTCGFIWQDGNFADIEPAHPGGSVEPESINSEGIVVGGAEFLFPGYGGMTYHAFLWQEGSMIDLGSLETSDFPPKASVASDVNDSCQVVGSSGAQSFIWEAGVMTPLWHNGEWIRDGGWMRVENGRGAIAINDSGQVVGSKFTADDGFRAMIWQDGVASDLNTLISPGSGWILREALDINNTGQIVGWGEYNCRYHQAFMLVKPDILAAVDVMPGNKNKQVNLKSSKKMSLAVLATPDFDPRDIKAESLLLNGASVRGYSVKDVDRDNCPDILLDFSVQDMNLAAKVTHVTLYGRCYDGRTVIGVGAVTIK